MTVNAMKRRGRKTRYACGRLLGRRGGGEEERRERRRRVRGKEERNSNNEALEEFWMFNQSGELFRKYFSKEDKDEDYVVDAEFLQRMRNNYKQTFQDLKVVGWYFCSVSRRRRRKRRRREEGGFEEYEQIGECVKDVIDCPMVLLTVKRE